jgi:putative nucleotidyltransferase with HDIG domain
MAEDKRKGNMKNPNRVLLIDRNAKRRKFLWESLRELSIHAEEALSLQDAIGKLHPENGIAMAIISQTAFEGDTHRTLGSLKSLEPGLSVLFMAKVKNPKMAASLIERGIVDHIISPDNLAAIYSAVRNEFQKKRLIKNQTIHLKKFKKLKEEQRKNLKRAMDLEEIYDSTLENLMTALDLRDVETFGHSKTVARYTQMLTKIMGIKDNGKLDNMRKGSLLHDVGKIAIPDSILKKTKPLTSKEWDKIKLHPMLGYGLIKEIKLVDEVGNIILYHHERYDGKGYPKRLKKEKIPMEARIFALADALDAITSHRPYRKERSFKTARNEIQSNAGSQFDPNVVDAFCSVDIEIWEKIRYETTKLVPHVENFIAMRE